MDYTSEILELYNKVLDYESSRYNVNKNNFKLAVHNLNEAYSRNPDWQNDYMRKMTDFNNPASRCAYLHKYAKLHSGLVIKILQTIFRTANIHNALKCKGEVNLCSLGGGPGTEIVSLMFVLQEIFGYIRCSVEVIDYSLEWEQVFQSILAQLRTGRYGKVKDIVSSWYFSYKYHSADLLNASYYQLYQVNKSIKNAEIITMIKFMSAAACDKTRTMVMKIFQTMKPGGMLLFVDNAAGGFDIMMRETARQCGMVTVFGPVNHYDYENRRFNVKRHGYASQYKTRVSIEMWKKVQTPSINTTSQLRKEYLLGPRRSVPSSSNRNQDTIYVMEANQVGRSEGAGCCSII